MLIGSGQPPTGSMERFRRYEMESGVEIYVSGFLFDPAGNSESAIAKNLGDTLFSMIRDDRLPKEDTPFNQLLGNFLILMRDPDSCNWIAFGDNSGMYKACFSDRAISSSFFEIVDKTEFAVRVLDEIAVSDFLHFQCSYSSKTLLSGVQRLERDQYLLLTESEVGVFSKRLPKLEDLSRKDELGYEELFEALAKAAKNRKLSVDLTGGQDSRLNVALLNYYTDKFETALSGYAEHPDLVIGSSIAKVLGKTHWPTIYQGEGLTFDALRSLVCQSDALVDVLWFHRIAALSSDRVERNIDLQISGIGGELFKDFNWLQDFPFFWSRNSRLERYYNMRIEGVKFPHHLLSKPLQTVSQGTQQRMLEKMKHLVLDRNTQTYDNIYFNITCQGFASQNLSARARWIDAYSPLMELRLVRSAFRSSRWKRLLGGIHRHYITLYCPQISRIPTTVGSTCSSKAVDYARDVVPIFMDFGKRALKQVARKVLRRNIFIVPATKAADTLSIRHTTEFNQRIDVLKTFNILDEGTDPDDIPDALIGQFISLSFILERGKFNALG